MAVAANSGCQADISPQPEPPVRGAFEVDFGSVEAKADSYTNDPSGLRGGPGSAKPPGATIRAVNLDGVDDAVEGVIEADGSFALMFSIQLGDEVRVQIFANDQRSDPFDVFVVEDEAPPILAQRSLGNCWLLTPALELDLTAGSGRVRVQNNCTDDLVLGAPYLRRPVPGLTVGAGHTWPLTVTAGTQVEVTVEIDGSTPVPMDEVVFLEATAPQNDRRPITVRAAE